ncbi:hypothetical protein [Thiohalophilus sp.]|uniref:hypothetical protein n=1 Tax=Thiohalophilus sp. TaxID=3028392 RepID=UPI002ACEA673|nr:hypothetical protein [Thiohalophilus sp.]MDZ7662779.1 hypothetical protein [Thiohalophilus sp.]
MFIPNKEVVRDRDVTPKVPPGKDARRAFFWQRKKLAVIRWQFAVVNRKSLIGWLTGRGLDLEFWQLLTLFSPGTSFLICCKLTTVNCKPFFTQY